LFFPNRLQLSTRLPRHFRQSRKSTFLHEQQTLTGDDPHALLGIVGAAIDNAI
jgi:hypothetical protein